MSFGVFCEVFWMMFPVIGSEMCLRKRFLFSATLSDCLCVLIVKMTLVGSSDV